MIGATLQVLKVTYSSFGMRPYEEIVSDDCSAKWWNESAQQIQHRDEVVGNTQDCHQKCNQDAADDERFLIIFME